MTDQGQVRVGDDLINTTNIGTRSSSMAFSSADFSVGTQNIFQGNTDDSPICKAKKRTDHAERPETPPSPLSTVPFRRDDDFVDRGTLLEQIAQKCAAPASRVALVGMGGVGSEPISYSAVC